MILLVVRLQYFLLLVTKYVVLPVFLIYFGLRGILYWVDVWGRPTAQKVATLEIDGVTDIKIYYPKSIRLNGTDVKFIELESGMGNSSLNGEPIKIELREFSDYIELVPEMVELPGSGTISTNPKINISSRDLDGAPTGIDILILAVEPETGSSGEQIVRLTIDNTFWRLTASLAVIGALVSFFATFRSFLGKP